MIVIVLSLNFNIDQLPFTRFAQNIQAYTATRTR